MQNLEAEESAEVALVDVAKPELGLSCWGKCLRLMIGIEWGEFHFEITPSLCSGSQRQQQVEVSRVLGANKVRSDDLQ